MKLVVYFLTRGSFCPTQMGYFDHQVSLFTASYMIFCIVKQVCCALMTYAAPCNSIFIFCLHCLIWIILFPSVSPVISYGFLTLGSNPISFVITQLSPSLKQKNLSSIVFIGQETLYI